jgi:DNA-binding response OmpR family regulator
VGSGSGGGVLRILLVEDDLLLGSSTKVGLEQDGFAVDWVNDAAAADRAITTHRYDAVVLDLGLPGTDGETLLRDWRARGERTPVVVLTGRGFVLDRVRLLNFGADDYLVKPFDLTELDARVRAVVRRAAGECGSALQVGQLQLIPESQTVLWRGQPVVVTSKEFWLLEALVRNKNRVLTRRQLEDALYGWGDEVESNAVEVHIHHLRRKISRDLIVTVRGAGYGLRLDAVA